MCVVKILEMQWLDTAKLTVRRVRKIERERWLTEKRGEEDK